MMCNATLQAEETKPADAATEDTNMEDAPAAAAAEADSPAEAKAAADPDSQSPADAKDGTPETVSLLELFAFPVHC